MSQCCCFPVPAKEHQGPQMHCSHVLKIQFSRSSKPYIKISKKLTSFEQISERAAYKLSAMAYLISKTHLWKLNYLTLLPCLFFWIIMEWMFFLIKILLADLYLLTKVFSPLSFSEIQLFATSILIKNWLALNFLFHSWKGLWTMSYYKLEALLMFSFHQPVFPKYSPPKACPNTNYPMNLLLFSIIFYH